MPNLKQIYTLREQYGPLRQNERRVIDYLEKSETRDVLLKAFQLGRLNEDVNETRLFSFINENLNPSKPGMIEYFEEGREQDVALLYIDITSFSKRISTWSNTKIKNYLDAYYKQVIPLIYSHGGEIEKLMGDGIICLFGKPFLNVESPDYVYKAEDCAEDVIKMFYGTDKNVKVAINKGSIHYYKVPGEHYGEYTMIGQPITELYRLESVSKPNAINFFEGSEYDKLTWALSKFDNTLVRCLGCSVGELQGVDFKKIKYMMFPDYE